ncbi:terpenoid synthase [Aulographum hederae CBS 113979]|uniref:geranylgeranyl diphosphate synthase n=1 Tax=Aulographum hederae CBS 113979 TaxID=1176131 RepID=A0A6G1GK33_9PEZI|nr:terpenoid synthase [Aulographum hederae CBS 113979]
MSTASASIPHADSYRSPNAIPPRTSSTGVTSSSPPPAGTNGLVPVRQPSKPVLKPLSEDHWLSQGKKTQHQRQTSSSSAGQLPQIVPGQHSQPIIPQRGRGSSGGTYSSSLAVPPPLTVPEAPEPTDPPTSDALHKIAPETYRDMDAMPGAERPATGPAVQSKTGGAQAPSTNGLPEWSAEKERILLAPYDYMLGHPGKDIRTQLITAFNIWLRVPAPSLAIITKVVGMLHTASLLVDDVEDSSLLRRGVPVAHSIFGVAQTINSSNYVYFLALKELSGLRNFEKVVGIYTQELLNLHRGQGMDLFWRDTLTCPSEEDYLEMVGNKTGGLFRLAVKLMMAESDVDIDCTPLASTISQLFQILDDTLNLLSPTLTAQKGIAEDLTEGKFSFPVIHAIHADPENLLLINILKQKTEDENVKKYAVEYMKKMGSFEYAERVMEKLRSEAEVEIGGVKDAVGGKEGSEGAEEIGKVLAKLKVDR